MKNYFLIVVGIFLVTDLTEPCQISQTHMLHRCNLIAIVGTGPGAKFFNDKGDDISILCYITILREVGNKYY